MKTMRPVRILVDLDEVLADFIGAALSLWGKAIEDVLPHWEPGYWGCTPALSKSLGLSYKISDEEFWRMIHSYGIGFWRDLSPHPWMKEILQVVKGYTDDWHIVTSPSQNDCCYVGKRRWAEKHLGRGFNRLCMYSYKEVFAGPRVILIDDSDANIQRFREHGGQGIVFPRHNNSLYRLKDEPMKYVKQALTATIATLDDDGGMWGVTKYNDRFGNVGQ